MIEANTDRLWFTIGAIIVGSLVIFGFKYEIAEAAQNIFAGISSQVESAFTGESNKQLTYMKGGNISVFSATTDQVLADVNGMDLNAVTVPVRVYMDSQASNADIEVAELNALLSQIETYEAKDIEVIVEPFPFIDGGTVGETEYVPADSAEFMANWEVALLSITQALKENDLSVYGMYIGSNLVNLESRTEWSKLIDDINEVDVVDNLIYRLNWWYTADWAPETLEKYNETINRPFLKKLDMIAIAAYFEITDASIASADDLQPLLNATSIWGRNQPIIDQIEQLHKVTKRNIIFGEFGIANYKNAYAMPYAFQGEALGARDESVQSIWYQAWLDEMNQFSWFKGFSVFAIGDTSSEFYPNLEAQDVVRNVKK